MLRYLTLAALLVATSLAHPDYSDTWEEFKQKYEKEYESEDEEVISIPSLIIELVMVCCSFLICFPFNLQVITSE